MRRELAAPDQVEAAAPQDRTGAVVGDRGEVPLDGLPRPLVEADPGERLAAAVGHHDLRVAEPDRVVREVQQPESSPASDSSYDVTRTRCGRLPSRVSTGPSASRLTRSVSNPVVRSHTSAQPRTSRSVTASRASRKSARVALPNRCRVR